MPPTTEPIPVQILENMHAALSLPDGGADYFYSYDVVPVGGDITQQQGFPSLALDYGEIGRYYEERSGSVLWHTNLHWEVSVIAAVDGIDGRTGRLLRVVHDVHRAMMVDQSRGNLAIQTLFTGWRILPGIDEMEGIGFSEITFDIHFRTRDTDMLLQ